MPITGAVVGGAAGSPLGPAGSAVGAGIGATVGEMYQGNKELSEAKDTIKALTTGDVDKLVEDRLAEARDTGFFDGILNEIYDFLTLALLALVAWNVVPLVYTWMSNKKIDKKINGGTDGKTD